MEIKWDDVATTATKAFIPIGAGAFCLWLIYRFEVGYCTQFSIPIEFIEIEKLKIIYCAFVSLALIALMVIASADDTFEWTTASVVGLLVIGASFCILLPVIGLNYSHLVFAFLGLKAIPQRFHRSAFHYAYVAVLLLILAVGEYFNQYLIGNSFPATLKGVSVAVGSGMFGCCLGIFLGARFETLRAKWIESTSFRIGSLVAVSIFAFTVPPATSEAMGEYIARNQKEFSILSDGSEYLVLRRYGSNLILRNVENLDSKPSLGKSLRVVPISAVDYTVMPISFSEELIFFDAPRFEAVRVE